MKRITCKIAILILVAALFLIGNPLYAEESKKGHFVPEEHPEIIAALEGKESARGVIDALVDAGTNWTELWGALSSLDGILWAHACWLIANMPHLDRLEMTKEILIDHVRFAYATRKNLPYKVPEQLFKEYILTYRIGDEPVRKWRSDIWFKYDFLKGDSAANTARRINKWVNDNLTVRERGFFGPRPDPLSIIASGSGTEADIAAVAIAMCKTFGVAARVAKIDVLGEEKGGRTWLEVYIDDGRWVPMYPHDPKWFGNTRWIEHGHPHNVTVVSASSAFNNVQVTSRYTPTGRIKIKFLKNGKPLKDFQHFSICAWNNGAWLPLDDLQLAMESGNIQTDPEAFIFELGDGFYVIEAGVRNARGDVYVQTFPANVEAGKTFEQVINLDIPPSESELADLIQRNLSPLPEVQLDYASPSGSGFWFPKDISIDEFSLFFIFDANQEPSIRMFPLVLDWAKTEGITIYGIGIGVNSKAIDMWRDYVPRDDPRFVFFDDNEKNIAKAFGSPPGEDNLFPNLPVVLLLGPNHSICYLSDGYNLAIKEALSRAKELVELAE